MAMPFTLFVVMHTVLIGQLTALFFGGDCPCTLSNPLCFCLPTSLCPPCGSSEVRSKDQQDTRQLPQDSVELTYNSPKASCNSSPLESYHQSPEVSHNMPNERKRRQRILQPQGDSLYGNKRKATLEVPQAVQHTRILEAAIPRHDFDRYFDKMRTGRRHLRGDSGLNGVSIEKQTFPRREPKEAEETAFARQSSAPSARKYPYEEEISAYDEFEIAD